MLTHLASGCPFDGAAEGEVPVGVVLSDGQHHRVTTLQSLGSLVSSDNVPVRITFRSGRRVGATVEDIVHFERELRGETRGYHLVGFPRELS